MQQDLLLQDDTPSHQLQMALQDSIKDRQDKNRTNVELIESIRMEAQLMEMRFNDFSTREHSIYSKFVERGEEIKKLKAELQIN